MKKIVPIAAIAIYVIGVLFWVVFLGLILFYHEERSTDNIVFYRTISGEIEGENSLKRWGDAYHVPCDYTLPQLPELMPYASFRFDHTVTEYSLFHSYSYSLVLKYDAQDYPDKKAWLETVYPSLEEGIPGDELSYEPEFELDGFWFRSIEGDFYPKNMLFIGYSDSRQEIAIIFFFDQDLDYMDTPPGNFLCENTGWNKVVE